MSDKPEPDKWTLRNVPRRYQERVTETAQRLKLSNAEIVCRALDLYWEREREPFDALPPESPPTSPASGDSPMDVAAHVVATACRLAEARGVPKAFRAQANAVLLACLPRLTPSETPIAPRLPPPSVP